MACKYIYDNIEYSSKDEFVKNVLIPKKVGGEAFYKQILQLNKELSISKKSLADFKTEAKNINSRVLNEKIQNYENMVFQGGKMIDSLLNTLEYSITGNKITFSKSTPKYTKILFPTGNTIVKIEQFDKIKEQFNILNSKLKTLKATKVEDNGYGKWFYESGVDEESGGPFNSKQEAERVLNSNIDKTKRDLQHFEDANKTVIGTINFYENTVANILKKQGYSPKTITDEYGNTWNEITITAQMATEAIKFQSPKLEYSGDLAIEEKIAEMAEKSKDETVPKTLLEKFIQTIKNLLRNLYKEKTKIERLIRDLNQGRFADFTELSLMNIPEINTTIKYQDNNC